MDSKLSWHLPGKFLYKSGWQVAAGEDSIEVVTEPRRELEVPEAVLALPIAIPLSPMEPSEPSVEVKNMEVPEIPLAFVEDKGDEMREGCNAGNASGTLEFGPKHGCTPDHAPTSMGLQQQGKPADQGPLIALVDVDANAAAAAAAAYAVLKAKERGTLVDHNLLIKILTNPILIKTLLAFNKTLPEDMQRALEKDARDGCNHVDAGELSSGASAKMGCNSMIGFLHQGSNGTELANHRVHEASNSMFAHHHGAIPNTRPFLGLRAEEQPFGCRGQGNGALRQMECLSTQQSVLTDLGLENSKKEGPSQIFSAGFMDSGNSTERGQASALQAGVVNKQIFTPFRTRNDGGFMPDGGEMPNSRFQKPCLYFNTPRGCRRGNSCFYLHDPAPEKVFMDQQGRAGVHPFQQAKRPKFGVPDRDRNFY